jgi:hypothetical protein
VTAQRAERNITMNELEKRIIAAMIETGRAAPGWRFKIQSIDGPQYSDWATITGVLIKKRCRKPIMGWEIACYKPKSQIWWDRSRFVEFAE